MNKSKKLIILLGVLIVVCVAAFAVTRYEEHKEEIKNSDEIILTIDPDTVTALSWKYDETSLSFHKDDTWVYDDDEAFPTDDEKIASLLEIFKEFGVSFVIDDVEDYGQYGLEDPTCTIDLTADGKDYEVKLGAYSTMDSKRYVSIGDGKVYLVNTDPMDTYKIELADLIKNDTIPDVSEATDISFSGDENYEIVYKEEGGDSICPDDVYFTDGKPLDTSKVTTYLNAMNNFSLTDFVTYNATDEELTAYGLDTPALTVTVEYPEETEESEKTSGDEEKETVSKTLVLNLGQNQEELEAYNEQQKEKEEALKEAEENGETIDPEDEEEDLTVSCYARVGDSQIVYQISDSAYERLMEAGYDDMRHSDIMTASFDDIDSIDVKLENTNYSFNCETEGEEDTEKAKADDESSEDEEVVKTWYYKDKEISFYNIQSAIKSLETDSFEEISPNKKEEVSFTIHLDNEKYPEINIQLYRYDGSDCIAVVDGKSVGLIDRSKVVDLIEDVNAIVLND